MNNLAIEGKWIGHLTYGRGYPLEYSNLKISFAMNLRIDNGRISGDCEDDITKELLLRSATIEGELFDKSIYLTKQYPCLVGLDENFKLVALYNEPSHVVQYRGKFSRGLFSGKNYFRGSWEVSARFLDKKGVERNFTAGGRWMMEKMPGDI